MIAICQVTVSDQNSKEKLGGVKTAIAYQIENWSEFYNAETKQLNIPNEPNVTLNSIAISTTRGIMFSVFRGTILHNAFLPVVDPKGFKFQKRKGK